MDRPPESGWLLVYGAVGLVALVPIVWAIVDVLRRAAFPAARKVLWVATLAVGWLILWPMALASSLLYLFVYRRRFAVQVPPAPVDRPHPMPLPPAGWYPDPSGRPGERWWDGLGWSDHLR